MKSRRLRWAARMARNVEARHACRVLVGESVRLDEQEGDWRMALRWILGCEDVTQDRVK